MPNPFAADFDQLDCIACPIFVLEIDDVGVPRYVAFNTSAREKSGGPLSRYVGRTAMDVFPDGYGLDAYKHHCDVVHTGKRATYELDLPLAAGVHRIRTTLVPYCDPKTGHQLLYGSFVDVTMEQPHREKQDKFDALTKEMEQFVALAAHDLRAPLRNMATLAALMKEDFVDKGDGKAELLDMMENVAKKSMVLISDVLNHAGTTKIEDRRSNFDLSDLCQDIFDVLDPQQEHQFSCTFAEVSTDRTALQIALRNIIDNAIKFGGKVPLKIDIRVHSSAKGMLEVMVSDDGGGFSEAAIKFLNGGAFRVDSGYGLLGVRRMVEARGGTIRASNGTDQTGAIIQFCLPGEWLGAENGMSRKIQEWSKTPYQETRPYRRRA